MNTRKLVTSALMIALGLLLPFVTMQIPLFGKMLLPMHIPVILGGFMCGGVYGAIVGAVLPLLRSVLFGAPPMMPVAIAMSVELMIYGLVSGLLFQKIRSVKYSIIITLIITMVVGRIAWGLTMAGLFSYLGNVFTVEFFMAQAFINALPGIALQLVLIPIIIRQVENRQVRS